MNKNSKVSKGSTLHKRQHSSGSKGSPRSKGTKDKKDHHTKPEEKSVLASQVSNKQETMSAILTPTPTPKDTVSVVNPKQESTSGSKYYDAMTTQHGEVKSISQYLQK